MGAKVDFVGTFDRIETLFFKDFKFRKKRSTFAHPNG
jgi:hypothetical protein